MKGVLACLLSLVLVVSSFGATGASAAEETKTVEAPTEVSATYDWEKNEVKPSAKAVIYVVKKATGNDIKAGAKCTAVAAGKSVSLTDLGVKGTNKDVYLYVCNKEFEAAGKSIAANLVIKAQAAKKLTVNVDYTKADDSASDKVLSATAVDSKKAAIDATTIKLWWSKDGNKYDTADTFTGAELAKMLKAGGGLIYVKMEGKSGASGDAQFACKAVKVKIAKPAKAPSAKVDVKKDTVSLKNGFDFGVAVKSGKDYTVATWYTILPVLKTAGTKTAELSIIPTSRFAPVGKKSTDANAENDGSNKVAYTAYKFKAVSFETILTKLGVDSNEDFILAVRKSATEKKPASDVSYYKVSGQTLAPIVLTESKVDGQYLIASGKDFAKKGISLGSAIAYPGTNGEDKKLATTGFDKTFKVGKAGNKDADGNGANFEYCIVKTENLFATEDDSKIDFSTASWKKFDPAKAKFNAKTKSKYNTVGGSKVEAVLAASDKADGFNATTIATTDSSIPQGTVILVRRAGVKGKTVEDAKRNSEYTILYVVKDENGTYEIYGRQTVGAKAWKYSVKFAKLNPEAEGGAGYFVDESATLSQWVETGKTSAETEIPKEAKFEYVLASGNPSADGKYSIPTSSNSGGLTTKGNKLYAGVTGVAADNVAEQKSVYLIREFANVTVTINYEASDGKAIAADKITIKDGVSSVSGVNTKYYVGEASSTDISYEAILEENSAAGKKLAGYKIGDATMDTVEGITLTAASKTIKYTGAVVPTSANVDIEINITLENVEISFDAGDGSGSKSAIKIAKDEKLTEDQLKHDTITAPTEEGFDFAWDGWYNGNVKVDTTTKFSVDTTLVAKWTKTAKSNGNG